MAKAPDPIGNFWRYTRPVAAEECWVWTGPLVTAGYGRVSNGRGHGLLAHRVAWEIAFGPIPEGLVIDHLCREKLCVNPNHLDPVTQRINVLRGVGPIAQNAVKTHCVRGHPYAQGPTPLSCL